MAIHIVICRYHKHVSVYQNRTETLFMDLNIDSFMSIFFFKKALLNNGYLVKPIFVNDNIQLASKFVSLIFIAYFSLYVQVR